MTGKKNLISFLLNLVDFALAFIKVLASVRKVIFCKYLRLSRFREEQTGAAMNQRAALFCIVTFSNTYENKLLSTTCTFVY